MRLAPPLGEYPVVELRRYVLHDCVRERFATYFESLFPEAFQALGALVFGLFFERNDPSRFTFLRAFPDMDTRLAVCTAMYDGPLWREHRDTMNAMIVDYTDVLLLKPVSPGRGLLLLPAVDVVEEAGGARGVFVAQVFPAEAGRAADLADRAEQAFAGYRAAGAREAGVLVTLDVPNNFPRHPIREDGHYLVWLGLVENDAALAPLRAAAEHALPALASTGLLRGAPELIVMDPARRSRLRWLDEWSPAAAALSPPRAAAARP